MSSKANFLSLPKELRDSIYESFFIEEKPITVAPFAFYICAAQSSNGSLQRPIDENAWCGGLLAIVQQLGKAIAVEVAKRLLRDTVIHLPYNTLEEFLLLGFIDSRLKLAIKPLQHITRMTLFIEVRHPRPALLNA